MLSISKHALAAVALLGREIRIGRTQRGWSQRELAERAGVARATLQKIEAGDPGCAVGSVLEVATLVGVRLFETDADGVAQRLVRAEDKISLLPKAVHGRTRVVDDDF